MPLTATRAPGSTRCSCRVHRLDVCVRRHDEDVEIRRELGGVRRRGPDSANRDANGFARRARVGRGQPHRVRRDTGIGLDIDLEHRDRPAMPGQHAL